MRGGVEGGDTGCSCVFGSQEGSEGHPVEVRLYWSVCVCVLCELFVLTMNEAFKKVHFLEFLYKGNGL